MVVKSMIYVLEVEVMPLTKKREAELEVVRRC